jgi:hypothetical protein
MDMKYPDEMNRKGLLYSRDDQTVEYRKPAYHALRNLAAVFDDMLERIAPYGWKSSCGESLSVFGYAHRSSKLQVVTIWLDGSTPSDSNKKTAIDIGFPAGCFREPVYVDLRTGKIYAIPKVNWSCQGNSYVFTNVPCYDSPILIADESLIPQTKALGN